MHPANTAAGKSMDLSQINTHIHEFDIPIRPKQLANKHDVGYYFRHSPNESGQYAGKANFHHGYDTQTGL